MLRDGLAGNGIASLASAVTEAHHGSQVLIDGILRRSHHIRRVHVDDRRVGGHRARPFQIQIGLAQIGLVNSRVRSEKHRLRIVSRQVKARAKSLDIGKVNAGLSQDGNCLPGAIDNLRAGIEC